MPLPPRYNAIELQLLLDSDTEQPRNLNEQSFINDIQSNTRIKWEVNQFLFKRKLLLILLDNPTFKKWKLLTSLNWLITFFIIGFAIWAGDYRILFFLLVFPFLIITFDHWIFMLNLSVVIGVKLLFKLNIPYFYFFVASVIPGYLIKKAICEMIERKIVEQALTDWTTFWKYYSNKIIFIKEGILNKEYQLLIDKYPELRSL